MLHGGLSQVRNRILQISRQTIPYVRELRPVAKSVTGCLLMQQLDFHFAKYPDGFYKFLEPCPNSKSYKRGQSWQEDWASPGVPHGYTNASATRPSQPSTRGDRFRGLITALLRQAQG